MSVFRTHHERNYTLIDNIFMRDTKLSNSTIGLACKMFSLPPDWEFSEKGLAAICKDGVTSIRTSLHELEANGYLIRTKIRKDGRVIGVNYDLFETPKFNIGIQDNLTTGIQDNLITQSRTSSVKSKELDLEKVRSNNNKDNNNKDQLAKANCVTDVSANSNINLDKDNLEKLDLEKLSLEIKDNIIKKELNKDKNKDTISKDIGESKDSPSDKANINDLKDKDLLAKENNHLDKDNLEKKNNNSRNLKKVLIPFIQESFIDEKVKEVLVEWILDVFANGKTLTLKQLINQCDLLTENSKTKEDLIDTVQRTLEGKWSTFRFVIENKNKTKTNNSNGVRITEQKRTVRLGKQAF